jgi:hypothetical protein
MAASQISPLFALPLKLRTEIYEELLCPNPTRIHTLYHDRQGREPSFNLHPKILRVNKQVYDEAASLLYRSNIFEIYIATNVVRQCTGGIYPDHIPNPPPLLRKYEASQAQTEPQNDLRPACPAERAVQPVIKPYLELGLHGIIYLHCFQRLRHIRLVTSRGAIWGQTRGGSFFTRPGELIMQILQDLSDEAATSGSKILEFIVHPDWRTKYGIFQAGRTDAEDGKAIEMAALLQSVRRTRIVEVEEKVFSDELGRLETRQVDVDGLIASLAG